MGIDPRQSLLNPKVGRFVNYLHWYCKNYTVKKVSSMVTYWRTLSQLYIKWQNGTRLDVADPAAN
jgi:hypothetical protein